MLLHCLARSHAVIAAVCVSLCRALIYLSGSCLSFSAMFVLVSHLLKAYVFHYKLSRVKIKADTDTVEE